jgi:tungstate transport system ATP-binding protein
MTARTPILEISHFEVRRGGATVLDIPLLSLARGEVLCLIGPNGAGKSSLLLALAHLVKHTGGTMTFRGNRIDSGHSLLHYRRSLSMVFQEPLLFDTTVFENVASGLKIRGMRHEAMREVVARSLERFGIGHLAQRAARKLSGGEAQRTSLARAFATEPEIVFLDEPFSSLDPPTRESLMENLDRVLRETKTTAVMATHDQMEALRLSDRMAVMHQGRIVQIGTPEEIMNTPADAFVASFVGMQTVFSGPVTQAFDGTFITTVAGRPIEAVGSATVGEAVVCFIRPENVVLSTNAADARTSARNVFPCKIVRIVPMGFFHRVQLDCDFPLAAHVTNQSLENLSLKEGASIFASFKATAIHVIRVIK